MHVNIQMAITIVIESKNNERILGNDIFSNIFLFVLKFANKFLKGSISLCNQPDLYGGNIFALIDLILPYKFTILYVLQNNFKFIKTQSRISFFKYKFQKKKPYRRLISLKNS